MAIITLLTDFGTRDPFVGIMKGVILQANPNASIVDISHSIDPQDVVQAAYELEYAYRHFPDGTVHVAVVDPDVGGNRAILALQCRSQKLLAPDNGVLSLILRDHPHSTMVRVTNERYFRKPVSSTFHGRDIFAPVAAHLSLGLPLAELGEPMKPDEANRLALSEPGLQENGSLAGTITAIDRFGNLVTDVSPETLRQFFPQADPAGIEFRVGKHIIRGVMQTYGTVEPGDLLALVGSRGCYEFSVNRGNAAGRLAAGRGDRFTIRPGSEGTREEV